MAILTGRSEKNFLFFPRHILAAKVTVGGNGIVVHIQEMKPVNDSLRSQIVILADILFDEPLVLMFSIL